MKKKLEIVQYSSQNGDARTFKRFKEYARGDRQLRRIKEQVREGVTKRDKMEQLDDLLFQKFCKERSISTRNPVHDFNLHDWAVEIAFQLDVPRDYFTAGHTWISEFKKRHNIVKRKTVNFSATSVKHESDLVEQTCLFKKQEKR